MNTVTRLLALTLLTLAAAGCGTTDDQQQNPNASSIPWNRPQSWEGQGALGGFTQGPQGSTGH